MAEAEGVVSWTVLLEGVDYGILFYEMPEKEVTWTEEKADDILFTALVSAFSVVDGKLEEAKALTKKMPMTWNEVLLAFLLRFSSIDSKDQLGQLYSPNVDYNFLLSNMYALAGKTRKALFFAYDSKR
ncbi:hypothetical protein AgCh_012310 [Apium graveolens]